MEKHDYRIDRLRLLACFGVVLLHSSAGTGPDDLALNALFRFSVPVFVLISGWFQLNKPIPGKHLAQKSLLLFAKLLLWSGFYLVMLKILWNEWPADLLTWLLTEPVHLWYLYAAIGLNLMTPVLYPFVRSATKSEYRYTLAVCFLLGCVTLTLLRLNWFPALTIIFDKSKLPNMLGFQFLYLLGGYFRRFGFSHRRLWLAVGLCSSAVSIYSVFTPYMLQFTSFISPNAALSGCACFVLYMTRPEPAPRFRPFLRRAADCTMGIYLLHPLVDRLITPCLAPIQPMMLPSLFMLLSAVCIFTICIGIICPLTLVKPLKKYVL